VNDASQCAIAGGGRVIVNTSVNFFIHVQCLPSSGVRKNEEGGEKKEKAQKNGREEKEKQGRSHQRED